MILFYELERTRLTAHLSGCIVQHFKKNSTREVYPCNRQEVDCFYTGSSTNHSDSWVAATICGGMVTVLVGIFAFSPALSYCSHRYLRYSPLSLYPF